MSNSISGSESRKFFQGNTSTSGFNSTGSESVSSSRSGAKPLDSSSVIPTFSGQTDLQFSDTDYNPLNPKSNDTHAAHQPMVRVGPVNDLDENLEALHGDIRLNNGLSESEKKQASETVKNSKSWLAQHKNWLTGFCLAAGITVVAIALIFVPVAGPVLSFIVLAAGLPFAFALTLMPIPETDDSKSSPDAASQETQTNDQPLSSRESFSQSTATPNSSDAFDPQSHESDHSTENRTKKPVHGSTSDFRHTLDSSTADSSASVGLGENAETTGHQQIELQPEQKNSEQNKENGMQTAHEEDPLLHRTGGSQQDEQNSDTVHNDEHQALLVRIPQSARYTPDEMQPETQAASIVEDVAGQLPFHLKSGKVARLNCNPAETYRQSQGGATWQHKGQQTGETTLRLIEPREPTQLLVNRSGAVGSLAAENLNTSGHATGKKLLKKLALSLRYLNTLNITNTETLEIAYQRECSRHRDTEEDDIHAFSWEEAGILLEPLSFDNHNFLDQSIHPSYRNKSNKPLNHKAINKIKKLNHKFDQALAQQSLSFSINQDLAADYTEVDLTSGEKLIIRTSIIRLIKLSFLEEAYAYYANGGNSADAESDIIERTIINLHAKCNRLNKNKAFALLERSIKAYFKNATDSMLKNKKGKL